MPSCNPAVPLPHDVDPPPLPTPPSAEALDSLGIAACAFDAQHRTLWWNRSFLRLFPEHDGHVHAGEPYAENLRRFYGSRLPAEESANLERYIADGVARHAQQAAPFVFEHRGRWLRVAADPLPGGGRLRLWVQIAAPGEPDTTPFAPQPDAAAVDPVYERMTEAVMVLDAAGRIVAVNHKFLRLYGLAARAQAIGHTYQAVLQHRWDGEPPTDDWQAALRDNDRFAGAPFEMPLPGDRWVRVQSHLTADGLRYSVHTDMTALHRKQRALEAAERSAREAGEQHRALAQRLQVETARLGASEARFRAAFDQSAIATALVGPDGVLLESNAALAALLGMPLAALPGRALADLALPPHGPRVAGHLAQLSAGDPPAAGAEGMQFEAELARAGGGAVWVCCSCARIEQHGGQPGLLLVHVQDTTDRKRAETERDALVLELQHQASRDGLTGLHNRRSFHAALAEACTAASERGARASLAFIDLDGFKQLNDSAGHAAGDAALAAVAGLFLTQVRGSDVAARLGGDEFALLLHRCDTGMAEMLAGKLLQRIEATPFGWQGRVHALGASIGVTPLVAGDTPESALQRADAACYAAKAAGRGRVQVAAGW